MFGIITEVSCLLLNASHSIRSTVLPIIVLGITTFFGHVELYAVIVPVGALNVKQFSGVAVLVVLVLAAFTVIFTD